MDRGKKRTGSRRNQRGSQVREVNNVIADVTVLDPLGCGMH